MDSLFWFLNFTCLLDHLQVFLLGDDNQIVLYQKDEPRLLFQTPRYFAERKEMFSSCPRWFLKGLILRLNSKWTPYKHNALCVGCVWMGPYACRWRCPTIGKEWMKLLRFYYFSECNWFEAFPWSGLKCVLHSQGDLPCKELEGNGPCAIRVCKE